MSKGWKTPESWKGWDAPVHGKRHAGRKVDFLKVIGIAAVVIVSLLLLNSYYQASLIGSQGRTSTTAFSTSTTSTTARPSSNAGLLIAVKGSDPKMAGGTIIQSFDVVIRRIDLHDASSGRWTNFYDGAFGLNFVSYLDNAALVLQTDTTEARYDSVRVLITNASMYVTNPFINIVNPRLMPVELPGYVNVNHTASTKSGKILTLVLDLDLGSSFTRYGAGYTMVPNFKVTDQTGIPAGIKEI
jgi:hypothetical protein